MSRSWISASPAAVMGLISLPQASGEEPCRPVLAFKKIDLSEMRPPTLERVWIARITVDASRCVADSRGFFEVAFSRQKENAPETEFRERFMWKEPSVTVGTLFAADEAVERFWFDNIEPCACRD